MNLQYEAVVAHDPREKFSWAFAFRDTNLLLARHDIPYKILVLTTTLQNMCITVEISWLNLLILSDISLFRPNFARLTANEVRAVSLCHLDESADRQHKKFNTYLRVNRMQCFMHHNLGPLTHHARSFQLHWQLSHWAELAPLQRWQRRQEGWSEIVQKLPSGRKFPLASLSTTASYRRFIRIHT